MTYLHKYQPDHDFIAGEKRRQLPDAWLRAIPILGAIAGAAIGYSFTSRIGLGLGLGTVTGWAAYQLAAHRWSKRSAGKSVSSAEVAGD